MYLKALEVAGFKSFADKVRLELKPGITCVIGPNGCGKSNVVDSIRWCIGEMSWKSLRSASMVDIIFNGTAKRQPTNMSEVNMIFDNASKRLPLDFSEVTVTRRIFRSGESEYFLNKVQCRLRDVRDLFLDTGIGGEGYAIIDQGGVEFVLSSSPEQRRELFEEAAGVSKYKAKRDEAQRKLEKVDQDLARLMDSVVLIEEQIKKLDAEARKARLYQKNREELRESEIALALLEIKRHEETITASTAQLNPLNEQISDKSAKVSMLEGEVAALNLNLTHKQAETAQFSEKIATIKYELGRLEGDIQQCDTMTSVMTSQLADFDKDDSLSNARKAELEPQVEKIRAQITSLVDRTMPLQEEYDSVNSRIGELDAEINASMSASDKANADLMRASQAQMECSNRLSLRQSALSHDNEDLINLEKEFQKAQGQHTELEAVINTLRSELEIRRAKLAELRANIESFQTQKSALTSRQAELAEKISSCRSKKAALNATMEMLLAQAEKDPYWVGAQAASSVDGCRGTLRKQLHIQEADRMLAEEAMGEFLDAVLCDTLDTARRAAETVRAHGNARCRFIALSAVPPVSPDGCADSLKSRIQYPPELENIISLLLGGCRAQGSSVEGKFWLVAGADSVQSTQAYRGQQEDVRLGLETEQKLETELSASSAGVIEELQLVESELASNNAALGEEISKESALAAELASREQSLGVLDESMSLMSQEKTGLMERRDKTQAELARIGEEMVNCQKEQERLRAEIENIKNLRQQLQEQSSALKARREETNRGLSELRGQRNSLEADLRGVSSALSEIMQGFEKRASQRVQAQDRIEESAEMKLASQAKLSTQRDALAELEVSETKLREELTSLKGEFDEKTKSADVFKKELNTLQMQAHDLEIQINSHTSKREEELRNLQENWQTTMEEARMKYSGVEVDLERVKMLRRRLENMGAVNMTAPEEYDALSARDQFLRTQINDLEQAKNDLKAAIARINATTRENFRHTYDQVRDHFRRIYQTLFVGGEADLILTLPDNLLETGVEIMAQPPGKKLQSISSMSGGEKALTALALLFSFFCVNPSPFCIMDEADAPLDEANVERFVGLIKEFASTTQFIIITHNKRTMESADVLYGVTMEEQGVSKVMSVALKKDSTASNQPLIPSMAAVTGEFASRE
jgi:chromosome segregation protein